MRQEVHSKGKENRDARNERSVIFQDEDDDGRERVYNYVDKQIIHSSSSSSSSSNSNRLVVAGQ